MVLCALLSLVLPTQLPACDPPAFADPASVLVLVQDNLGPEPGTGNKNAGQFVADYYIEHRRIPVANVVHVATYIEDGQGSSCIPGGPPPHDPTTIMKCDPAHGGSTNIHVALYRSQIEAQVKAKITALAAAGTTIRYLVPTYGVPLTVWTTVGDDRVALDGMLARCMSPTLYQNPYYTTNSQGFSYATSSPAHIDKSTSPILIVSRLDGPDTVHSAALVDKAIVGETVGVAGVGYFDWQGITTAAASFGMPGDGTMDNAYQLCKAMALTHPGQSCVENNQQPPPVGSGKMIQIAPKTAWAFGWYDTIARNAGTYSFASGAVGAQLTSLTANTVRQPSSGAYVAAWLAAGITATWGAVNEPGLYGYALGDNLLNHLWNGYTFGEAAYISAPDLTNMVFVGDPLYTPQLN